MDVLPGSQLTASAVRHYVNDSIASLKHRGVVPDAAIDVLAKNFIFYFAGFYMSVRDNPDQPAHIKNGVIIEDNNQVTAEGRCGQLRAMITATAILIRISKLLNTHDRADILEKFKFYQDSMCARMNQLCPDMIERIEANGLETAAQLFALFEQGALPEVIALRLGQAKKAPVGMQVRVDYVIAALQRLMRQDFEYKLPAKAESPEQSSPECRRVTRMTPSAEIARLVA